MSATVLDERVLIHSDRFSAGREYWLRHIGSLCGGGPFETPGEDNGGPVLVHRRRLDRETGGRVLSMCRGNSLSVYLFLLTAYGILWSRYSRKGVVVIGCPEFEESARFFAHSYNRVLPLLGRLDQERPFKELLLEVRALVTGCRQHQQYPLSGVLEELGMGEWGMGCPTVLLSRSLHKEESIRRLDQPLQVTMGVEEGEIVLEVSNRLTLPFSIEQFLGHYEQIIAGASENPGLEAGAIGMLSAGERKQLVEGFNRRGRLADIMPAAATATAPAGAAATGRARGCLPEKTIADLLSEQAARMGEKTAVLYGEEAMSYGELEERSNQLGHYLRARGVREESLVGICMGRSPAMVIGIWGVLKAGGAYVPMDPGYPLDRIGYMLEDTGVKWILTDGESHGRLQEILREKSFRGHATAAGREEEEKEGMRQLIMMDSQWEEIGREPGSRPETELSPGNLAYVIYTSGSTGRPKGVMIEHGNVYSFVSWCAREFEDSRYELVYAGTSICFDLSVFELLYPLSKGKQIRLLENGLSVRAYLGQEEGILLNTVPGLVLSLLREGVDLGGVKVLNMAGEPIPREVLGGLDSDRMELRNLYGPTETTTYSSCYRIRKGESLRIGHPIDNTEIYILDGKGELVPVGVAGEICIGGSGVGRGYWRQAALTSEKFGQYRYEGEARRMYKTGDVGRWLADGTIEYLGREDGQVKVRGYRIETGEIERVLEESGLVGRGLVAALAEEGGGQRLVGYVSGEGRMDRKGILDYLSSKLPGYMVPSVLVEMEEWPLTANGKIDRRRLPSPEGREMGREAYEAPRNEIELKLTEIWQELLGIEKVGIHNNFFLLGGHSMLGLRLVAVIRKKMNRELSIGEIFEYPTIASLADSWKQKDRKERATARKTASSNRHLPLLQDNSNDLPVFLIPGSGGRSDAFQQLAEALGDSYKVYGIHQKGTEKKEKPAETIREVAAQNIKWIRKVQPHGAYRFIAHCFGSNIAYEMAIQLEKKGEAIDFIAVLDGTAGLRNMPPPNDEAGEVMRLIAGYFDSFDILKPPYPEWITDLKDRLSGLPVKEMMPYLSKFVKERIPRKRTTIEFVSRLINVRIYNEQMVYRPSVKIAGDLLVFKPTNPNRTDRDELLGWDGYAENVKAFVVPGDHDTMINRENSRAIAGYLKERVRH